MIQHSLDTYPVYSNTPSNRHYLKQLKKDINKRNKCVNFQNSTNSISETFNKHTSQTFSNSFNLLFNQYRPSQQQHLMTSPSHTYRISSNDSVSKYYLKNKIAGLIGERSHSASSEFLPSSKTLDYDKQDSVIDASRNQSIIDSTKHLNKTSNMIIRKEQTLPGTPNESQLYPTTDLSNIKQPKRSSGFIIHSTLQPNLTNYETLSTDPSVRESQEKMKRKKKRQSRTKPTHKHNGIASFYNLIESTTVSSMFPCFGRDLSHESTDMDLDDLIDKNANMPSNRKENKDTTHCPSYLELSCLNTDFKTYFETASSFLTESFQPVKDYFDKSQLNANQTYYADIDKLTSSEISQRVLSCILNNGLLRQGIFPIHDTNPNQIQNILFKLYTIPLNSLSNYTSIGGFKNCYYSENKNQYMYRLLSENDPNHICSFYSALLYANEYNQKEYDMSDDSSLSQDRMTLKENQKTPMDWIKHQVNHVFHHYPYYKTSSITTQSKQTKHLNYDILHYNTTDMNNFFSEIIILIKSGLILSFYGDTWCNQTTFLTGSILDSTIKLRPSDLDQSLLLPPVDISFEQQSPILSHKEIYTEMSMDSIQQDITPSIIIESSSSSHDPNTIQLMQETLVPRSNTVPDPYPFLTSINIVSRKSQEFVKQMSLDSLFKKTKSKIDYKKKCWGQFNDITLDKSSRHFTHILKFQNPFMDVSCPSIIEIVLGNSFIGKNISDPGWLQRQHASSIPNELRRLAVKQYCQLYQQSCSTVGCSHFNCGIQSLSPEDLGLESLTDFLIPSDLPQLLESWRMQFANEDSPCLSQLHFRLGLLQTREKDPVSEKIMIEYMSPNIGSQLDHQTTIYLLKKSLYKCNIDEIIYSLKLLKNWIQHQTVYIFYETSILIYWDSIIFLKDGSTNNPNHLPYQSFVTWFNFDHACLIHPHHLKQESSAYLEKQFRHPHWKDKDTHHSPISIKEANQSVIQGLENLIYYIKT